MLWEENTSLSERFCKQCKGGVVTFLDRREGQNLLKKKKGGGGKRVWGSLQGGGRKSLKVYDAEGGGSRWDSTYEGGGGGVKALKKGITISWRAKSQLGDGRGKMTNLAERRKTSSLFGYFSEEAYLKKICTNLKAKSPKKKKSPFFPL